MRFTLNNISVLHPTIISSSISTLNILRILILPQQNAIFRFYYYILQYNNQKN